MAHVSRVVRACARSGKRIEKGESVGTAMLSKRSSTKFGNRRETTDVIRNFIKLLPTQCIYVFCVDLRTNSDYFPIQH